jgi:hypothetical protein
MTVPGKLIRAAAHEENEGSIAATKDKGLTAETQSTQRKAFGHQRRRTRRKKPPVKNKPNS